MTIDEVADLEAHFRQSLGIPVFLEAVTGPVAPPGPPDAGATPPRFGDPGRAASWARGRAALQRLAERLTETGAASDLDPACVRFPHPFLSLTHTGTWAVAAGTVPDAASGIGVDLELRAGMREGAERFFLGSDEIRWLLASAPDARDRERVRLWTVKEALFKANPRNRDTLLGHYLLEDPGSLTGTARWREEAAATFRYAGVMLDPGALSLAIRRRDDPS